MGQIKNIKLHIVTDIKNPYTKQQQQQQQKQQQQQQQQDDYDACTSTSHPPRRTCTKDGCNTRRDDGEPCTSGAPRLLRTPLHTSEPLSEEQWVVDALVL